MIENEIFNGESKYCEFKECLPEKSIKYMKTVVAFSNGIGGKIIFGVKDDTREIVGIDNDNIFKSMDSITNAISDSCEPAIIPDVTLQSIGNKTVIVVEIGHGNQTPYYIKSLGRDQGTFIRVAGTTRIADENRILELLFEGKNKSYDKVVCRGITASDEDIQSLCKELKQTAIRNSKDNEKELVKDVTKNTLINWGVLVEEDGEVLPTNAYALLTGNPILEVITQCGVFKGTDRSVFIDRRELTGPIQCQVEEAYKYVLSKINLGASIEGLYRHDEYELPIKSVREIIANAITHRSYIDIGNVQIALFDDRLEITSPGMLLNGVTIEKMKEGYSKVRNKAIANAFTYMKIIEQWGSGIPRLYKEFKDSGLEEPELIDMDGDFRVNLNRRRQIETIESLQKTYSNKSRLDDLDLGILDVLRKGSTLSQKNVAELLNEDVNLIKYRINRMKGMGFIHRKGTSRKGSWIIAENEL